MITLLEIFIDELSIKKKNPYAGGAEHDIYKSLSDPTKIFKVKGKNYNDDIDWINLFKKYPKYFPIVYRFNNKGAEVEKLDVNRAAREYTDITKAIDPIGNFEGLLDMIGSGNEDFEVIKKYIGYLQDNHPDLTPKFVKFISLVRNIQKNTGIDRIDAHAGNFGYDKSGKLKMIDI